METEAVSGQWYWNAAADPWSPAATADWRPYNDGENQAIEEAFHQKKENIVLGSYIINFSKCTQFNVSNTHKKRPIKRVTATDTTAAARIGRWYWNAATNPWSIDSKEEWRPYNDTENQIIEKAFIEKRDSVVVGDYILSLDKCVQVSQTNAKKRRPIKRVDPGENP